MGLALLLVVSDDPCPWVLASSSFWGFWQWVHVGSCLWHYLWGSSLRPGLRVCFSGQISNYLCQVPGAPQTWVYFKWDFYSPNLCVVNLGFWNLRGWFFCCFVFLTSVQSWVFFALAMAGQALFILPFSWKDNPLWILPLGRWISRQASWLMQ